MVSAKNFYNRCGKPLHDTFPIVSANAIVSMLFIGEDGEINESITLKR